MPNCNKCSETTNCTVCEDGYKLSDNGKRCLDKCSSYDFDNKILYLSLDKTKVFTILINLHIKKVCIGL